MRISTDKFQHNAKEKTFTAEASDLPHGWMDGVSLVSPRKTVANFFVREVVKDLGQEDIECWVLRCETNPKVADYKMVIYND